MSAFSCFRGCRVAFGLGLLLSLLLSRSPLFLGFLVFSLSFLLLLSIPLLSPFAFLTLLELDQKSPCLLKRLEGLDHLRSPSSDSAC
jgi:hypothetical protein